MQKNFRNIRWGWVGHFCSGCRFSPWKKLHYSQKIKLNPKKNAQKVDENFILSDKFHMFWDMTDFFHHRNSLSVVFSENFVQKDVFASM